MIHFALVFLGAGLGGTARYGTNVLAHRLFGGGFPAGTLAVNVAGSLLMGVLVGVLARKGGSASLLHPLLATGFLGGFTTFSTFSLDTVALWENGAPVTATLYALLSVTLALGGLLAGLMLTRHLT